MPAGATQEPSAPHPDRPRVVGSLGEPGMLAACRAETAAAACDLVEIRLDLLLAAGIPPSSRPWAHLDSLPLLFTARCPEEGGAAGTTAAGREAALLAALPDAAWIDVELASVGTMPRLMDELAGGDVPWLASHHDFSAVPAEDELDELRSRAAAAGASMFKVAAELGSDPAGIQVLAGFLRRSLAASPGLPVSVMGMGPLAPVSRLLLAQLGSVFNYGYLGDSPTAPGQWSAARLREAIQAVEPLA